MSIKEDKRHNGKGRQVRKSREIRDACVVGDLDKVKSLVSSLKATNLLYAVRSACVGDHGHVLDFFIEKRLVSESYCVENFLSFCEKGKVNIVRVICKHFNIHEYTKQHALFDAVSHSNLVMVRLLLEMGANFKNYFLPFLYLESEQGRKIFKILLCMFPDRFHGWLKCVQDSACKQSNALIEYMYRKCSVNKPDYFLLSGNEIEYLSNKHALRKKYKMCHEVCPLIINIGNIFLCKDVAHFLHKFVYRGINVYFVQLP